MSFKVCLAQINTHVGDFEYNFNKISDYWRRAKDNADIIIFPELAICGYNPQDLLFRSAFLDQDELYPKKLISLSKNFSSACIIGNTNYSNNKLYNSASFIYKGKVKSLYRKMNLPNRGVFDEKRWFTAGSKLTHINWKGKNSLLLVCQDIWKFDNYQYVSENNIDLIVSINASQFSINKHSRRLKLIRDQIKRHSVSVAYLNLVGAEDTVVYDGGSFIMNRYGDIVALLSFFKESSEAYDLEKTLENKKFIYNKKRYQTSQFIYDALVLALQDYCKKHNFKKVILGFLEGINAALTGTIAMDARGK